MKFREAKLHNICPHQEDMAMTTSGDGHVDKSKMPATTDMNTPVNPNGEWWQGALGADGETEVIPQPMNSPASPCLV